MRLEQRVFGVTCVKRLGLFARPPGALGQDPVQLPGVPHQIVVALAYRTQSADHHLGLERPPLEEQLTGRGAEIAYEMSNLEVAVPSGVGDGAERAVWSFNGTLKIRTRDGSDA